MRYKNNSLFSSLTIKNLTVNNRLVMPPMALDIATEHGKVTSRLLEHYLLHAGGVGLIITEHAYVTPGGKAHPCQLGIHDNSLVPGLKLLVDTIHLKGIPLGIQISHAGARAQTSPVGPSADPKTGLPRYGDAHLKYPNTVRELSIAEIKQVVLDFKEAAARAKKAGFDLIEIHGAHGYLLNQFYSPLTNLRTDEYGGSLEKRLRLPLEVIQAVKEVVGTAMPVFYRLGADDRLPGGTTLDDSKGAVPFLVEAGVDCLDLSGGISGYLKDGSEGFFNYLAEGLKKVAGVPVLVTGGIKSPTMAQDLVAEGIADLVGIGRALLADPSWACQAWQELSPQAERMKGGPFAGMT